MARCDRKGDAGRRKEHMKEGGENRQGVHATQGGQCWTKRPKVARRQDRTTGDKGGPRCDKEAKRTRGHKGVQAEGQMHKGHTGEHGKDQQKPEAEGAREEAG